LSPPTYLPLGLPPPVVVGFALLTVPDRHMDDGCSKRFDIGTLDLRTESYDGLHASSRPAGSPIAHMAPPPGSLPPLAMPSVGGSSLLAPVPPPLRSRELIGPDPGHPWGR